MAEKIIELEPKFAVDQYLRWRIVEDRKRELGIRNSASELERRAKVMIERTKSRVGIGRFQEQVASNGFDEKRYLAHLAGSRMLDDMLSLEKIIRYRARVEDSLEIDRMIFAMEEDARDFVARAEREGFDKAADATMKGSRKQTMGRIPRETFTRSLPPSKPLLDARIIDALFKMSKGEITGVETSRSNYHYVIRLNRISLGRNVDYARVRASILRKILEDPPAPEEYRSWIEMEFSKKKIVYSVPKRLE